MKPLKINQSYDAADRRQVEKAIPDSPDEFLNETQKVAIRRLQIFGWELKFIRRPLFQDPVIGIWSRQGEQIGTLEEDGRINLHPDIQLRE